MDATGKLAPGITGIVVCLILVMAVALPVMHAMIAAIPDEESVPGPVTASGTNGASLDDAYALLEPSRTDYHWLITTITDTDDVVLVFSNENGITEEVVDPSGFKILVSSSSTGRSILCTLDGNDFRVYFSSIATVFTIPTNAVIYIDYEMESGVPHFKIHRFFTGADQERMDISDVDWVFAKTYETQLGIGRKWMGYEPTHGFMSGGPSAFLGDGSAFHMTTDGTRTLVDLTPAAGLDQRVFRLDDGRILDLDDLDVPIKEAASFTKATSEEIGGPVLRTTVTSDAKAIDFSSSSATEVLSGTAADYVGTWTDVPFQGGLDVPRLDSVSSGGSAVSGWYVPLDWEYTGMGIVDREPMAKTVLSILPLVLVVALFILVVRWMQAGVGRSETEAFLGGRRGYDGWKDRR